MFGRGNPCIEVLCLIDASAAFVVGNLGIGVDRPAPIRLRDVDRRSIRPVSASLLINERQVIADQPVRRRSLFDPIDHRS